jgi:uncharacterized membrane protein
MSKQAFLQELSHRLSHLPETERDKAYAFYKEMLGDSMDDGLSEEEAVAKLGSMDDIVRSITAELPKQTPPKTGVTRGRQRLVARILLILASPVWLPMLLTLVIVLWTVNLAAWTVFASGVAVVIGCFIALLFEPATGLRLMLIGGVLAGIGCTALLLPALQSITKRFAHETVRVWNQLKTRLLNQRRYE